MTTRRQLDSLLASYRLARRQEDEETRTLQCSRNHVLHVEEAQQAVQALAETIQQEAHTAIADIVTKCLKAVFGKDGYEFRINFSQKRGRTEAELAFVRDGRLCDPTTAAGGGVLDVASLALRTACLVLSRPQKRRLLVMDEPMKMLSSSFRPAVAELLESLSRELGLQMVVVTHASELEVGKVVRL